MPDTPPPLPLPPMPTAPEPVAVTEADPDESANAPVLAHLVCTNPTCGHRSSTITVHADTVQPVHCGGCFGVLHCDHELATEQVREGTIGAPVLRTTTKCLRCGTVDSETRSELPPIDLTSLPAGILDQPITPGRIV